jgi:hypothetical protein
MSNDMVQGIVYKVFSRQVGRGTAYSIKLDGDDRYYGAGFTRPAIEAGDSVKFSVRQNAKGYWDADLKTLVKQDQTPKVMTNSVGNMSKDDYWRRKEERDLKNDEARNVGAARNTAIAFVDLLAKHDAIAWPAKAKQGDKEQHLVNLVEYYAGMYSGNKQPTAEVAEETQEDSEDSSWE